MSDQKAYDEQIKKVKFEPNEVFDDEKFNTKWYWLIGFGIVLVLVAIIVTIVCVVKKKKKKKKEGDAANQSGNAANVPPGATPVQMQQYQYPQTQVQMYPRATYAMPVMRYPQYAPMTYGYGQPQYYPPQNYAPQYAAPPPVQAQGGYAPQYTAPAPPPQPKPPAPPQPKPPSPTKPQRSSQPDAEAAGQS